MRMTSDPLARCNTTSATLLVLARLYQGFPQPKIYNYKVRKQIERNEAIRRRFANGEDTITLAHEYRISRKRVYQIIHGQRK
jgi:hypothetical protein